MNVRTFTHLKVHARLVDDVVVDRETFDLQMITVARRLLAIRLEEHHRLVRLLVQQRERRLDRVDLLQSIFVRLHRVN